MKVIITKNFKNWKTNEIVEVTDGYAKNFLIKGGYAQPVNDKNLKHLATKVENKQKLEAANLAAAQHRKAILEKIVLHFKLKTTNAFVHGSITNKQVIKALAAHDFVITKYELPRIHIVTLGQTIVEAELYKNRVNAQLTIMVSQDG